MALILAAKRTKQTQALQDVIVASGPPIGGDMDGDGTIDFLAGRIHLGQIVLRACLRRPSALMAL
jgi:hypothetical protein